MARSRSPTVCLGRVIGRVTVVDYVRDSTSLWTRKGCCHWLVADLVVLVLPDVVRGRLGLWELAI